MTDPETFLRTNPFAHRTSFGNVVQCCDVRERLANVKDFDAEQCRLVIALEGVQKTVREAAERRLRQLEKEAQSLVSLRLDATIKKRGWK